MAYYDNYRLRGKVRGLTKIRKDIQRQFLKRLLAHFRLDAGAGKKLLEIGPGTGEFAEVAKGAGYDYECIEPNSDLVKLLEEKEFVVHAGLCPPIALSDESFDLIYSSHVIEHLESPQQVYELVEECKRVLKPGGQLALLAPDYMRMGKYFWDCDYTHRVPITERRLKQILVDAELSTEVLTTITDPCIGLLKYPVNFIMRLYPYHLLESLSPSTKLGTFFYKIRTTFTPCVFAIAKKDR